MKNLRLASITLAAVLGLGAALHAQQSYSIDAGHSNIGFKVRHMGLTNVRGQFDSFEGTFLIDETDLSLSEVRLEIEAASVNTFHERRDADLRGENFFDVANHPTIVFESGLIEEVGDGEFLVAGELTMLGTTREIELPVRVVGPVELGSSHRLGAEGELTIDRQEWGMNFSVVLDNGGLLVSNEVTIQFAVELKR